MIERLNGQPVTMETRHDSYEKVDKQKRYRQIKEILNERSMTAKEIAVRMLEKGYTNNDDRNNSAPRLTELCQMGEVEPIGKVRCNYTGKTVTVYALRRQ